MSTNLKPKGKHGGSRPNAGRKPNVLRAELPNLMNECVPMEKRRAIVEKAVKLAEGGSLTHAQFIFNYLYGKPTEHVRHEGDDESPLRILLKLHNAPNGDEDA